MRIILFFLLISLGLNAQQEFGTYFFSSIHQSAELNPSFDTDQKIVIGLPSFYGMIHQRGISVASALKGQLVDIDGTRRSQFMAGTNLSILKVSYKHKKIRYSIAHNYKQFTDFQFARPLINIVANGNSSIVGGSTAFNPLMEVTAYSETVFGAAYTGDFSFGANVKLLNGIQNFYTERSNFELGVNDDVYQLRLQADLLMNSSFPIDLNNIQRPRLTNLNFVPRNFGLAFDLGVNYKRGPWNVAASLLDIGYLSWNDKVHNYSADGTFVYDGASFSDILDGEFNLIDTLGGSLEFADTRNSYAHFVPSKFYANVNYDFSPKITLGALIYGHRNFDTTNGALVLNVQRHWNHKHAVAFQYAVVGSNPLNLGLSAYTTLGPIQVYGVFDNVLGMVNTLGAENSNFRIGMNLVFSEPQQTRAGYAGL